MQCVWNAVCMECSVYGMQCVWNAVCMECSVYEMQCVWNAVFAECLHRLKPQLKEILLF